MNSDIKLKLDALSDTNGVCFFDFDGTLVDSMGIKGKVFAELFALPESALWTAIQKHHIEHGGMNRIEKIKHYHQICYDRQPSDEELKNLVDRFSAGVKDLVVLAPEICGASAFLKKISKNSKCYLLSATPQAELSEIISRRGWGGYFSGVFGFPISKEEILRQTIHDFELTAESCVYFGDAVSDYEVAVSVGVKYVMISTCTDVVAYCEKINIDVLMDYQIFINN